jgi:glycine cleavage system aminomethyltransferase T
MKHSLLHNLHTELGASFEETAGWNMPAHYGDVASEHRAVRQAVGIADLSHRGKIKVTGDDRVKWLQSIISNDILSLKPGQGLYSSLLTHKGKMLTYFRLYLQSDAIMVEDAGEIGETTFQALRKFLLYGTKAKMENGAESWGLLLVRVRGRCRIAQAGELCHGTDRRDPGAGDSNGRNR